MSNIARQMPTSYVDAREMLRGDRSRKIAHNTYLRRDDDDTVALRYHSTDIAVFYPDGYVTLNSGGYRTATTKDRISGVLRFSPCSVWQKDYQWYIGDQDNHEPFIDGVSVDLGPVN